jgi:cytochrome b involved in lipid metabolism
MKITIALLVLFAVVLGGGYWWSQYQNTATVEDTQTPAPAASTMPDAAISQVSYTLAELATHDDSKSCWAAINGSVYNLTSWISQHPGGAAHILSICGKDGSSAFNAQHGGQPKPEEMLATFKIGVLAQ